jgi:hypothetical protein
MNSDRDLPRILQAWLHEDLHKHGDRVLGGVVDLLDTTPQRRSRWSAWRTPTMKYLKTALAIGLTAAAAAVVVIVGLGALRTEPGPGSSPSASASASAPSSAVDGLVNAFLAARVAGYGAAQYLDLGNTTADNIPLLYATTSGARYERAEFKQVPGKEWPYGWTAFKVRLFAGDTVVEQLFFAGPDSSGLNYQWDGFGTEIPPTAENGQPVVMPYTYFDGQVTLYAAHPWVFPSSGTYLTPFGRLIPQRPGVPPTTDGGQRGDWDQLFLIADPALGGAGCGRGPLSADAAALAQGLRLNPDLGATAPVAVTVGGQPALVMDLVIPAGTSISVAANAGGDLCADGLLNGVTGDSMTYASGTATSRATGEKIRLYLFDVPEGLSMRIFAMVIVTPEARFQRAVDEATPVIDSIEFHTP